MRTEMSWQGWVQDHIYDRIASGERKKEKNREKKNMIEISCESMAELEEDTSKP